MANALLDQYKLLKEKVPTYGDNTLLSIKENKPVEPSYPSIVSPPADNTVAQLTSVNAAAPAETTPTKYFPDTVTTQALPGSPVQSQPVVASATTAATPVTTPPYTPQTEYEKYWKTPVGTSKYNMPLDQFVKVAGLAAKALNPQNPIANDLIKMGGEAYNERARREYESPNVLLQRQIHQAQLDKLKEEAPKAWDIYYKEQTKLGKKPEDIVKEWNKITRESQAVNYHYAEDEKGNVSVFVNGQLVSGSGKGKDITGQVAYHTVDDAGIVHMFSKSGKEIGQAPGGKTKEVPGTAAKVAAELKSDEIVETFKNPSGMIIYRTRGSKNRPPEHLTLDTNGQLRKVTAAELRGATGKGTPEKPLTPTQQMLKDALEKRKAKAKTGGTQPAAGGESAQYPEGTVIKNKAGKRKIMRNGQFVDFIQGEQ
jgi:hypothetical protein